MQLYTNGTILTMSEPETVEAVLTENGKIVATGGRRALLDIAPAVEVVDLRGSTMLPAFLDAHSHFSAFATSFLQASLEGSESFDDIKARIELFIKQNHIAPGAWVIANGYDHNALCEGIHPTLSLVDAAAPENPLILQHASGHIGIFNSLALKALGVTAQTPAPEGGRIFVADGAPTGLMEENAYFYYIKKSTCFLIFLYSENDLFDLQ